MATVICGIELHLASAKLEASCAVHVFVFRKILASLVVEYLHVLISSVGWVTDALRGPSMIILCPKNVR